MRRGSVGSIPTSLVQRCFVGIVGERGIYPGRVYAGACRSVAARLDLFVSCHWSRGGVLGVAQSPRTALLLSATGVTHTEVACGHLVSAVLRFCTHNKGCADTPECEWGSYSLTPR